MCVLAGERSRGSGDSTSATTRAVSAAAYALDGEGAALRSVAKPGREARAVPHEPRAECRGSKICAPCGFVMHERGSRTSRHVRPTADRLCVRVAALPAVGDCKLS